MKKQKILIIPYSHTLSHLSRPLCLAPILNERYEIIFAAGSSKRSLIKEYGFKVVDIFEPDPDYLFGNIRNKRLKFVSHHVLEAMIHEDMRVIDYINPDLVITDGRFSAPISCQIKRKKHVAIVNVSSTEFRKIPYTPFDNIYYAKNSQLRKLVCIFFNKFEQFIFDHVMNSFIRFTKYNSLKKRITATNCLTGVDLTLLADVPEYFPVRFLPSDYHYIGPLTWKPPKDLIPDWWPPDRTQHKLLYFSMGTTGEENVFLSIYELLKSSPYMAIITTGQQIEGLRIVPNKIFVEPYLDGDMVAEVADLIICHGGNGTIYQALSHGKPVIGIPTIPDQNYNMRRVEKLELGIKLEFKDIRQNPSLLIDKIQLIFNEKKYKENAEKFQQILKKYKVAGINKAVSLIDSILHKTH